MELTTLADGEGWRVGDTTFVFDYGRGSSADRFLIRKPPDLMDLYLDLTRRFNQATIVELGIAAGGSTALLSLLAEPRTLIACELDPEPVLALSQLIEAHDLSSVVRPFYGVNQADTARLSEIIDREVRDVPLDLVIDDASHLYHETRASFDVLFPRLRPGGWFIIEDWAADYAYARRMQDTLVDPSSPAAVALERRLAEIAASRQPAPPPLPRIGVELLHVAGTSDEVVRGLTINKHWIVVERGPADLDPATFRLEDHITDHWGWLAD